MESPVGDEEYLAEKKLWLLVESIGGMLIVDRPPKPLEAVKEFLQSGKYANSDYAARGAAIASDSASIEYLTKNRVGDVLERVLQYILLAKPNDPAAGIVQYLAELEASDGVFTVQGDDGSIDVQALLLLCRCAAPGRAKMQFSSSSKPHLVAPACDNASDVSLEDMLRYVAQHASPQYYPMDATRRQGINRVLALRRAVSDSRHFRMIAATIHGLPSEESSEDTDRLVRMLDAFAFEHGYASGPTVTIADFSLAPLLYFLERASFPIPQACLSYLAAFFKAVPAARPSFASIAVTVNAVR